MAEGPLTNKQAYERVKEDGTLHGQITATDLRRFGDTLKMIHPQAASVLDVGCFSGHWLHYLLQAEPRITRHLGIDVSEAKIADARKRFPELQVRAAYAEQLDLPDRSFDVCNVPGGAGTHPRLAEGVRFAVPLCGQAGAGDRSIP